MEVHMLLNTKLTKASIKFSGKFTYTAGTATKVTDKIAIICPIHGEFCQEIRVQQEKTVARVGQNQVWRLA